MEEPRLLLRVAEERRAVGPREVIRRKRGRQIADASGVLALRGEVFQVAAGAFALIARHRRVARIRAHRGVAWEVALEDLDDVARLAVEEVRDLVRAALEGDGEALPVDRERGLGGHKSV